MRVIDAIPGAGAPASLAGSLAGSLAAEQMVGGIPMRCQVRQPAGLAPIEAPGDVVAALERAALRPGSKVVLCGRPGSGKSTALRQLASNLATRQRASGRGPAPVWLPPGAAGRPAGQSGHVYLVDGLDEMARTDTERAAARRLLAEYLALADDCPTTSVIVAWGSSQRSDVAWPGDAWLVEMRPPRSEQLIAVTWAQRGPDAEPLLARLGIEPGRSGVAAVLAQRPAFAEILLGADPGWDTSHLPPVPLIDRLLDDWARRRRGCDAPRGPDVDVATRAAGWLFERYLAAAGAVELHPRERFAIAAADSSPGAGPAVGAAGAVGPVGAVDAVAPPAADLERCGFVTAVDAANDGSRYRFIGDEFRTYFTARYLATAGRLERWLADAARFWSAARAFPDDVTAIVGHALLLSHAARPDGLPRLLELFVSGAGFPSAPAGERRDRLAVALGGCRDVLAVCRWHRVPRMRAVVRQLVTQLAALYDEGARGSRPEPGFQPTWLTGDLRDWASRQASLGGVAMVQAVWDWCSRAEVASWRLFAVDTVRHHGTFEADPAVLPLLLTMARIEGEALVQDRQCRAGASRADDEAGRRYLLYRIFAAIHTILGAVPVAAYEVARIVEILAEVTDASVPGSAARSSSSTIDPVDSLEPLGPLEPLEPLGPSRAMQ